MTDSMKFGPEWLRNMSAEPSNIGATAGGGSNSGLSLHSLGGGSGGGTGVSGGVNMLANPSHTAANRNMFPEYRYGREEMLSLFDRNCLLPQILPSFKKLFIEKVQYPLALTPSSEDELNSQSQLSSSSRPAWLQRSPGAFGIASRGSGRGGMVDRGRMRGKSAYHSIYQRPSTIYDDSISAISMKPDRNWSERNGTGDSAAIGAATGVSGGSVGVGGGPGVDWNGTPSSSPRKDFSSQCRNMENWRRSRNDDGSGDGPNSGGTVGTEVAGWRSAGAHRWGRSTSWREEEPIQSGNMDGNSFVGNPGIANVQRSISVIGTVSNERTSAVKSQIASAGPGGPSSNRLIGSKGNQPWPESGCLTNPDGEDNLPEWAMENPSEMGGTFDSSGAFHGELIDTESDKKNSSDSTHKKAMDESDSNVFAEATSVESGQLIQTDNRTEQGRAAGIEAQSVSTTNSTPSNATNTKESAITSNNNSSSNELDLRSDTAESTPTHKTEAIGQGDISERFKEVADEVEKLIMDDDSGQVDDINSSKTSIVGDSNRYGMVGSIVEPGQLHHQLVAPDPASTTIIATELSHKPFNEQLSIQQQQQQHHLQQNHLQPHHIPVLPHVMSASPNELWFYRDPQSNVQGPFSAIEMTEWYRAGYFNENLYVRRISDTRFRPLGDLIKLCHGNMPFTHNHLLPTPIELDNLQINLTTRKPAMLALPLTHNEHHQQQQHHLRPDNDEQLKANVTAAADSLSAAVKGHMSAHTMDTSHMLTMRFQMLQDQYLQHQEYQILTELSKSDCFQRLDPAQREAVVRSKVQMLVLPEYLSSFSGLSNSLAALNPIAGNQLYDIIAQQAKKDQQQIYPVNAEQRSERNFLDADDFILNAQLMHQQTQGQNPQPTNLEQVQHQFASNSDASKLNEVRANDLDILNEYNLRMLLRGPPTASAISQQQQQSSPLIKPSSTVDFVTESQILAQNLMMPIWPQQQQQPAQSSWPAMENAKLWDVATLEEEQSQKLLLEQQQQKRHLPRQDGNNSSTATAHLDFDAAQQLQQEQQQCKDNQCNPKIEQQIELQEQPIALDSIPTHNKDQLSAQTIVGKQQQVNKLQQQTASQKQGKQPEHKISDEDRRREQVEEKRRIKEERKRQQQEEEKRRAVIAEEEKNRQQQEERERQQQIQAQRRKALFSNNPQASTSSSAVTGNKASGLKIEQVNRSAHATSIAPWSLQTPSVNNTAPGLAEIQKAERRERRADQQRQQEQLDKQMRATAAAAAEANDALLKWQASPAPTPVMSLVDIQAEEAKRLTNELLEQQRRRDHEQQQQQQHQVMLSANLIVSGSSGLSNIWGSANKAWSATGSPAPIGPGLWDEATLVQSGAANTKYVPPTAASVLAAGLPVAVASTSKPQSQTQLKSTAGGIAMPSPRNLRKSQTLPTMQNVISKSVKTATGQSSQQTDKNNKTVSSKSAIKLSVSEERKSAVKSTSQQLSGDASNSKVNEYESEFTSWCMKSLENMSAKVDVPTFVSFLKDLEAPYEVKDYVRIYLGEGKESSEFAKQFLERRSKYKSLQRAQNAHNDDMCKPAPAITPSCNDNGDNKNKQRKVKKSKMTKMDARILGFSVTAAEGRINVGGRDYVDGP
ncbi:GIGYF family protein Gyf [Drosophila mojavensis]|nr:GIGYF family protein Gyf [Drosophila mojavensis]XP_015016184.1 GIGYF family protein Gyf [Drosophila mojavensis]XP_015016185.1 GIGYF family protein Gyf [Drosophila mojavensis]EDW10895.1 uncharacterized protein Dmoj_GI14083, isoform A [Drosophila mojavensis]KRG07243.1 uncharacterized protein Dmoj_GI14083, isoform C [Drosophila mojavensis]KRG07244.1 uncharacterized protein Dmoj_GI14083, isoform D [Drosophila mojavensis]